MDGVNVLKKSGCIAKARAIKSLNKKLEGLNKTETELLSAALTSARKQNATRRKNKKDKKDEKDEKDEKDITDSLSSDLQAREAAYARIVELEKEFNIVELDESVKRKLHKRPSYSWQQSVSRAKREGKPQPPPEMFEVPLVWSIKLPIHSHSIVRTFSAHRVSTTAPKPIPEAIELISKHKKKFDHLECWWVPNKFSVKAVPPPTRDPILVGAVVVPNDKTYYFELTRWIDEKVEDGWWAGEGY